MKHRNRIAVNALLALPSLCCCAFGQGGLAVGAPQPFIHTITPENRPDVRYSAVEQRLARGVFDPAAAALLRASERFSKDVFHVPSLRFRRAVTFTDNRGDNFAAEWEIDESLSGKVP